MPVKPEDEIKIGANKFWSGLKNFFSSLIDLQSGLDREGTIVNIKNNKRMHGANAWLLMCSIMIASLGLDLNSPAVLIGAMLISPLMSPILGIGMGIGINDRATLKISLQHFGVAIAIALVTSTLYFLVTPLGEYTSEISSRTKPTALDVMVAFFGGIAGIISGSRKDKSNAIPGVAIATALMPPLCVTGYAFANILKNDATIIHLNFWAILSNSFYLFFLNATFVALATYLIVRFLRFPYKPFKDDKDRRRTIFMMSLISIIMIIPSMFILINVLDEVRHEKKIQAFIKENFDDCLVKTTKIMDADSFSIKIFPFKKIEDSEKELYRELLVDTYQINRTRLDFVEEDNMGSAELKEFVKGSVNKELSANRVILDEKDKKLALLNAKLDSLQTDRSLEAAIEKELKILFPELDYVDLYRNDFEGVPLILLKTKEGRLKKELPSRVDSWVRNKLNSDSCIVILE